MAHKISIVEIVGNQNDLQTAIQNLLDALSIAAGSEPLISVTGSGSRKMVFILYRDA